MAQKVLLLGATGTIGRAACTLLLQSGFDVVAPVRQNSDTSGLPQSVLRHCEVEQVVIDDRPTAIMSCVASRNGLDAWDVDFRLNSRALKSGIENGVQRFVLLSAICVQKPKLEFQKAKLAFEAELQAAPIAWNIVRTTAYFKSISGQIDRLRSGKPFLVFGRGELTSCKPISDRDAARYLINCLDDPDLDRKILPIGGPGPAVTPREQGEILFEALGLQPKFSSVPPGLFRVVSALIAPFGLLSKKARAKAELVRIGHYYATESMLVWDQAKEHYSAAATPEFGTDTLAEHFQNLAKRETSDVKGPHALF